MRQLKQALFSILIALGLLWMTPLVLAQEPISDYCSGIGEEIVYNQLVEATINDQQVFGRYCFRGRAGDVVTIQLLTTDGDLVLSGALSDRFVEEIYVEYRADSADDLLEVPFTLPENGSYLLLISRDGFGAGESSGTYLLTISSEIEGRNSTPEMLFPPEIDNVDTDWQATIAELQDADAISTQGELIADLDQAFFDGIGAFFTPIARDALVRDSVVSARLTFTQGADDQLETCSLLVQVTGDATLDNVLEVGLDSDGNLFWVNGAGEDFTSGVFESGLDLSQSHHLLLITQDEHLIIYLNGQRLPEIISIRPRSGSFGIALLGAGAQSRCQGDDLWVYQAPQVVVGLCEVMPAQTINRRAQASTNAQITTILNAGDYAEAVAIIRDDNDVLWYQLAQRDFVREDTVSALGDCDNLPDLANRGNSQ